MKEKIELQEALPAEPAFPDDSTNESAEVKDKVKREVGEKLWDRITELGRKYNESDRAD